eukprot:Gb_06983 [translate_table: standard]
MRVEEESRRMIKPATSIDKVFNHPSCNPVALSSIDITMINDHVKLVYAFESPTPPTSLLEEAIDMNDQGVVLIEASADGILYDAMPLDSNDFLLHLIPPTEGASELLLIQLTRFTCGGLAIGVARNHQVADGVAAIVFMNAWSQMVRGHPIDPLPIHNRSLLIARDPPQPIFDHIEYNFISPSLLQRNDGCVHLTTKRIHFSAELLKQIKGKASQHAEKPYTTFESLLAHLWRCVSKTRGLDGEVVTKALFSVNGRKRLDPPLPAEYFGNVISFARPETTVKDLVEQPMEFAANLIHSAVRSVDDEYIRSSLDFVELQRKKPATEPAQTATADGAVSYSPNLLASSWVNFSLYELDFGWGNPLYVGPSLFPIEGLMVFIPSYTKDGSIDAFERSNHSSIKSVRPPLYTVRYR